jgi:hypothetical protein
LLLGKQILFPQQCFYGWANRETFEETSRITNVSTTMFPSLPRALLQENTGVSGENLQYFVKLARQAKSYYSLLQESISDFQTCNNFRTVTIVDYCIFTAGLHRRNQSAVDLKRQRKQNSRILQTNV